MLCTEIRYSVQSSLADAPRICALDHKLTNNTSIQQCKAVFMYTVRIMHIMQAICTRIQETLHLHVPCHVKKPLWWLQNFC